jgi:hypothetical protein
MADRPLPYRDLLRILKRYGVYEEANRGKGSERMLARIIDGHVIRYPTRCHSSNDEKPRGVIRAIRRHFKLTSDDGVSDDEFYGR